jgi:hypothetical protein
MSVEKFQDRDDDYLSWVETHRTGYVINVDRSGHGYARMHHAACRTITSRPPFTGPYIKICSTSLAELDQWALRSSGTAVERCGTCQPLGYIARSQQAGPAKPASPAPADAAARPGTMTAHQWEIDGPGDEQRWVRLWSTRYIPFDHLNPDQHAARAALRLKVRSLAATPDEILHASYAGFKPTNMDMENLVLYNIDATAGGCFQPSTRNGVRFEKAADLRGDPPSGRHFECSYQYQLISPDSDLSHWRPVRQLVSFTGADLGLFPSGKRLEQVWHAIHRAKAEAVGQPVAPAASFAIFLTLSHPGAKSVGANPELVKALIDGTVAAFQAHGDRASAAEIAARLALTTGQPRTLIMQALLDDRRAVLGIADSLVHLRGTGLQWNPADHLRVAGQVVCRQLPGPHGYCQARSMLSSSCGKQDGAPELNQDPRSFTRPAGYFLVTPAAAEGVNKEQASSALVLWTGVLCYRHSEHWGHEIPDLD